MSYEMPNPWFKSSCGGVEGHAPEGSVSVAVRGLPERRSRDMEAAGWQREAETGRSPEMARVRERASDCISRDSDRIAGPAAARSRAGVKSGPHEAFVDLRRLWSEMQVMSDWAAAQIIGEEGLQKMEFER